jgi:hypothetical protein
LTLDAMLAALRRLYRQAPAIVPRVCLDCDGTGWCDTDRGVVRCPHGCRPRVWREAQ